MKFGTRHHLADVINCVEFYTNLKTKKRRKPVTVFQGCSSRCTVDNLKVDLTGFQNPHENDA